MSSSNEHEYHDLNENPELIPQYIREVEAFRREKDEFFKNNDNSPLLPQQIQRFTGLKYFPVDPKYRVLAKAEIFEEQEIVEIETNYADRSQSYYRYARVHFTIDGQELALTIYKSLHSDYYFLPFKDKTNNVETYGAGRYVEVEPIKKGNDLYFLIDFNFAYNPNCAYNDRWVCPVTPFENYLQARIEAGEKAYPDHM